MTRIYVLMTCMESYLSSKILAVTLAKLLIGGVLSLGKSPAPPAIAAEVASRPRPCWLAYPADARVVSIPDRTPWQPRRKAGGNRAEDLGSRHAALFGRGQVIQVTRSERRRDRESADRRPDLEQPACQPPQACRSGQMTFYRPGPPGAAASCLIRAWYGTKYWFENTIDSDVVSDVCSIPRFLGLRQWKAR